MKNLLLLLLVSLPGWLNAQSKSVELTGVPRTFITFKITPPEGAIAIRIELSNKSTLIGQATRPLSSSTANLLILGVPALAKSGRQLAATVFFLKEGQAHAFDSLSAYIKVSSFKKVVLSAPQKLVPGRAGQNTVLTFVLQNTGNALDTVPLRYALPSGWPLKRAAPKFLVMRSGAMDTLRLELGIPYEAASGSAEIHLGVEAAPDRLAVPDAVISISVINPIEASKEGIDLTTSVLTVPGSEAFALGLFAHGAIAPETILSARLTHNQSSSFQDERLFGRAGFYQSPPYVNIATPKATASLGLSSLSLSPLTGYSVSVLGTSASFADSSKQAGLVVGRPAFTASTANPYYVAGYYGRHFSAHNLRLNFANLDDQSPYFPRQLRALSISDKYEPNIHFQALGEIALRQSAGRSQNGYMVETQYKDSRSIFGLKYTLAPGGNQAFSRGAHEMIGFGSRSSGPFSLAFNGWYSSDSSEAFSSLHSRGISATPTWSINKHLSLRVSGTLIDYQAHTLLGEFGTETRNISTGLTANYGLWNSSLSYEQGQSINTTILAHSSPTPGSFRAVMPISTFTGVLGRPLRRGQFQLAHSQSRLADLLGQPVDQLFSSFGLMAIHPFLSSRLDRVEFSFLADRQAISFPKIQWVTARSSLLVPVFRNFSLGLNVEYSNQFLNISGQPPVSPFRLGIKAQYNFHIPVYIDTRSVQGRIYVPASTDEASLPLSGIIVHQGPRSTVTDKQGKYRLGAPSNGPVYIDSRSLPPGYIVPPSTKSRASLRRQYFAVAKPGRLTLRFNTLPSKEGRRLAAPIAGLVVYATDTSGTAWSTQINKDSVAQFLALAPGSYILSIDLSTFPEPAVVSGAMPNVVMGSPDQKFDILLTPRPLRVLFEGKQAPTPAVPSTPPIKKE